MGGVVVLMGALMFYMARSQPEDFPTNVAFGSMYTVMGVGFALDNLFLLGLGMGIAATLLGQNMWRGSPRHREWERKYHQEDSDGV